LAPLQPGVVPLAILVQLLPPSPEKPQMPQSLTPQIFGVPLALA
jgi:hypothetical protein